MDVLLASMTGAQLGEWQEFFELEPWGTPHEDLRFGMLLQLLYDANRDRRKSRSRKPWDWLPSCKPEGAARDVTRTPEGQHQIMAGIVARMEAGLARERKLRGGTWPTTSPN